ncbi:MAG TPA: phosphoglucosamine mutase [Gaiellales bacterium]
MRKLFGTDGVRGVAGVDLTDDLAHDLGAAAAAWAGPGASVLIGRDTRESGAGLENALVAGIRSAGGRAVRAGVIPTPGVAVLTRNSEARLGCVISASHNPYRDNGIKFIGGDGRKLADEAEAAVEKLVGTAPAAPGGTEATVTDAVTEYVSWLADTYGDGVTAAGGLVVDCANGAASTAAPQLFTQLGVSARYLGVAPDGRNINAGVGSTHLDAVAANVREAGAACGLAFDGDADRCLAVDAGGRPVNGDAIIAAIALARGVERVVVTSMTNLGFHRVMARNGIASEVTEVGDRYVLAGMLASGATLGGEQSGHVVDLAHHTTGDGLATALMLLAALDTLEMSMTDLADLVVPFPQRLVAVRADRKALAGSQRIWQEVAAAETKLGDDGRVVLRASGTEPVVRVMVEAEDAALCAEVCDHLVGIVEAEIGVT